MALSPYYIAKAEKKGRTKAEVDTILCWLTGYTPKQLEKQLKQQTDFETFFAKAPKMNPARKNDHRRHLRRAFGRHRGTDDAGNPLPG
jgi:hypothetical protein